MCCCHLCIYDRTFGTRQATADHASELQHYVATYKNLYVEPRLFILRGKIENGCKYEDHSIRCH